MVGGHGARSRLTVPQEALVWEVVLAVDIVEAHVCDLAVSIDGPDWLDRTVDQVCDMQGILGENDRCAVRRFVDQRLFGQVAA
jgi:hypothetical protein